MVTLFLRQGENGKQVLLSFPATTPAEKADVAATMESLKSMSKTVTIQGAASEVMNLGLYLSGVDLAAEGELERINQLAERLEHMSEVDCDKFAGMLDANSISGTRDILRLTEHLDDYVILPGCGSAQSIGKYLVGCGAFPVPEKLIGYINYEAVGIEFCDAHGGAPCARGYVVQRENLPRAILEDLNIDPQQRARPKLLTLYLRTTDGKERELALPVNNAKLKAVQQLGTAQIDLIHALRHQCVHIAQARARGRVNPRFATGQRLDQHVAAGSADQYVFQRAFSARNGSDHRRPLSRVVAMKAAS